jgi:hypothetical protein
LQIAWIIDSDAEIGMLGQGAEALDFVARDHLIGDEDVVDAAFHHHLSLGHLGRTYPTYSATGAHLHMGQDRAFEIFDMRSHLTRAITISVSDQSKVVLKSIQIDQQARGVEVLAVGSG